MQQEPELLHTTIASQVLCNVPRKSTATVASAALVELSHRPFHDQPETRNGSAKAVGNRVAKGRSPCMPNSTPMLCSETVFHDPRISQGDLQISLTLR